MERRRVERGSKTPGNTALSEGGGAKSGAFGAWEVDFPPDLGVVVNAWPGLSEADRKMVLTIVRKAAARVGEPGRGNEL